MKSEDEMTKNELLKKYWGHDCFRTGQEQVIDAIISGKDVLCVMPTGGGKSVCYQIPAMIADGITLVVSPLISLMKDQVGALVRMGVPAAYLNSSLTVNQYYLALERMAQGRYKIVYVAPERLLTDEFAAVCRQLDISIVAVDEAHCVSQWGQDFRPGYLKIAAFIDSLKKRPVTAAFTATATKEVKEDIINFLKLDAPYEITTGFDRKNLYFGVIKTKSKFEELKKLIDERKDKSGIVYCATRKNVDEVCMLLNACGIRATKYHAGLNDAERHINQDDFIYDRKNVMIATNAFGMGIDKSNVSYVIHYNMPKSMEGYYQEAGRAGRDGNAADCMVLFSPADVNLNRFLIDKSEPNHDLDEAMQMAVREKDHERLNKMEAYCLSSGCLRSFVLKYFGERSAKTCGNCSNCTGVFDIIDITKEARLILNCVYETGQMYGKKMITGILKGRRGAKISGAGLRSCSSYGIMEGYTSHDLDLLMNKMISDGYVSVSSGEYPTLQLSEKADGVFSGEEKVYMRKAADDPKKRKSSFSSDNISDKMWDKLEADKYNAHAYSDQRRLDAYSRYDNTLYETVAPSFGGRANIDMELFQHLKDLRRSIGDKEGVPAYVIFTDATLEDMCRRRPLSLDEFLEVSGVGDMKMKKYGEIFIKAISEHIDK